MGGSIALLNTSIWQLVAFASTRSLQTLAVQIVGALGVAVKQRGSFSFECFTNAQMTLHTGLLNSKLTRAKFCFRCILCIHTFDMQQHRYTHSISSFAMHLANEHA